MSRKILSMATISTTINKWIELAKTFHVQKMYILALKGGKIPFFSHSTFIHSTPDLNAMDVDAITLSKTTHTKRAKYIQEGSMVVICWLSPRVYLLCSVTWSYERELTWVVDHLLHSYGTYLLCSVIWSYDDLSSSVLHLYCNASPFAMGVWYPLLALGFQVPAHHIFVQQEGSIFYLKSLCICVPILNAAPCLLPDQHLRCHVHRQHQYCPALQLALSTTCIQLDVDSGC